MHLLCALLKKLLLCNDQWYVYIYISGSLSLNCAPVQFDYMFHTDGTIEVRVSATGYLQAGFWEPAQTGYGTAIRDTTST